MPNRIMTVRICFEAPSGQFGLMDETVVPEVLAPVLLDACYRTLSGVCPGAPDAKAYVLVVDGELSAGSLENVADEAAAPARP